MPTSSYMPDVKVQVAWNGGFRVPKADWTWTDISAYVELAAGLTINGGRGDERSTCDANTLTLTLDNSDGRFTAGRSTGAYYPDVVLYKPIRVLATPVDGAESHRFLGYVTSWPVEWEGTDAYAKATITATSRLARLGLNATWRSIIEETILADDPVAYYPLGEVEGSTAAADISGLGAPPLTIAGDNNAVVFGQATGPGTDDLTAATFAAGEWLSGSVLPVSGDFTMDCFFNVAVALTTTDIRLIDLSPDASVAIHFSGGFLTATVGAAMVAAPSSYVDGNAHHAAATVDGAGLLTLYVDGVSVGTDAGATLTVDTLSVGRGFAGVIAHAAVFNTALSSTRVLAHATAGLTAWAGETTDTRFERYADMAGIPAAEVAAEAGSTTTVHLDTTGQNIVDLLRTLEQTEAGVMFDDRDGTLTLHSRSHRYAATSTLTLDMAKHEVEADYSPRLDPSSMFNDITATGVVPARLKSDTSIEANGVATASFSTASDDDDEPLNLAGWALAQFATPKPRVPALTVDALAQVGKTVTCADVMAVTIGDKVTVANHPSQASVSISDYFVEGWTETYGPEALTITWNVSPSTPDDLSLIVGDALRGVVGTNYVAL